MASYTDQIPQFNPYVQQLPVEAMLKVGMHKQQRYDEGIQRIQDSVDKVAGLDVVRDVDRAYLQSKLNNLGNNLKPFMASDFSEFQLQNSAVGMANAIADDRAIQSAVNSTARYRKEVGRMEKAKEEGKSAPQNEWVFGQSVNAWMNDPELEKGFNGSYQSHIDVKKKAMEAIKALHPELETLEIPFVMDSNGNIDTSKVADAIKSRKIEGITKERIQQAISASLSPEDMNQLSIDGRYQFKDYGTEHLVVKAKNDYEKDRVTATNMLSKLEGMKKISSNPAQTDNINSQINYYKKLLGSDGKKGILAESFEANLKAAKENPDGVKFNLYKEGFIKEFAEAFSWENEEITWKSNPLRQQLNWVADMKHKQEVENRRRYEFEVTTGLNKERIDIARNANKIAAHKAGIAVPGALGAGASGDGWTNLSNDTKGSLEGEKSFVTNLNNIEKNIQADLDILKKNLSDDEISSMIVDWNDSQGDPAKATKVKPDYIEVVKRLAQNKNRLETAKVFQERLLKEAEASGEIINNFEKILKEKKNVRVVNNKGQTVEVTPREMLNIYHAYSENTTQGGFSFSQGLSKEALQSLSINERNFVETISRQVQSGTGNYHPQAQLNSDNANKLKQFFEPYRDLSTAYAVDLQKVQNIYNEKLAEYAPYFVPSVKATPTESNGRPTPEILRGMADLLYSVRQRGIGADENFNPDLADEFLSDANNKDISIKVRREGTNYGVIMTNKKFPGKEQNLVLTGDQVVQYFGSNYIDSNSEAALRLKMGGGSTDLTGEPEQAWLQKQFGSFPGVRNLGMTANLIGDKTNPDLFSYQIFLQKKNGEYTEFSLAGPSRTQVVGFNQGVEFLKQVTDDQVINALKATYPDYDFSQIKQ